MMLLFVVVVPAVGGQATGADSSSSSSAAGGGPGVGFGKALAGEKVVVELLPLGPVVRRRRLTSHVDPALKARVFSAP